MPKRLTRQEMYDLAWSEPMRTLAKTFGISDVGLAKHFHQMDVPVPPRGYWARKTAGKMTTRIPLPPRPVGLDDHTWVGGSRYDRYYHSLSDEEILGPLPPEPTFDESLESVESVRARLEGMIGKVTVPKSLNDPSPAVATLLRQDDAKREKQKTGIYLPAYDAPLYDTLSQRRRLRLLSAIFNATAKHGARADTWGSPAWDKPQNDFVVTVGHQSVRLKAGFSEAKRTGRSAQPDPASRKLLIILDPGDGRHPDGKTWEDGDPLIEQQAREIVLAIMLRGEEKHREAAVHSYERRVKLKADTIERLRKAKEEADRKERERQAELERKRVERLLQEADAFRRAREIQLYVEDAREANRASPDPLPPEDFEVWAAWASAQADRIDPVLQGAFRKPSSYEDP